MPLSVSFKHDGFVEPCVDLLRCDVGDLLPAVADVHQAFVLRRRNDEHVLGTPGERLEEGKVPGFVQEVNSVGDGCHVVELVVRLLQDPVANVFERPALCFAACCTHVAFMCVRVRPGYNYLRAPLLGIAAEVVPPFPFLSRMAMDCQGLEEKLTSS